MCINATFIRDKTIDGLLAPMLGTDKAKESDFTLMSASIQSQLESMELSYTTGDFEAAVAQLATMTEETAGWVFGARDPDGDAYLMIFRPVLEGIGSFKKAFINFTLPYEYLINEFGLGYGWRLGFSAIETYFAGIDNPSKQRLITSDGTKYEIFFTDVGGDSNLEDYKLTDLRLEQTGNGYPGATYTLFHADGRCEYFDDNGRNIAIVDRYGNSITLEYTVSREKVSQIKIIDTVGNTVLYRQEALDPDTAYYLPGEKPRLTYQYDCMWTLSLNGNIIKTYYSFTNPNYDEIRRGRVLKAVENELSERTTYTMGTAAETFNCFVSSPTTNDAQYARASLGEVEYPTGYSLTFRRGTRYARYGFSGYCTNRFMEVVDRQYTVKANDYVFHLGRAEYVVGDSTGYYTAMIDEEGTYYSKETQLRINQVLPTETNPTAESDRYIWPVSERVYKYNQKGQLLSEEEMPCDNTPEDRVTTTEEFDPVGNAPIGTLWKKSYTYNSYDLPVTISTQYFNLVAPSSSRTERYSYTYDSRGNVRTVTQPNGQVVTYTYSPDYSIPLTKTYHQDAATTLVESNSLTSDKKSVATQTVTSNGNTVEKTTFAYDAKGRMTGCSSYMDATHSTEQQFAYENGGAQITEATVLGVKDASGTLVAGSPGYPDGVIAHQSTYNTRGWLTGKTDGNGHETTIAYDATGRVVKVTEPDGTYASYIYAFDTTNKVNSVTYTDNSGSQLIYKYDPFGHCLEVYDPTGGVALQNWSYDSRGQRVMEVTRSLVGADQRTYYYYDSQNRMVETGIRNMDNSNTKLESYDYRDGQNKIIYTAYGEADAPTTKTTLTKNNMGHVIRADHTLGSTVYTDTYTNNYLGDCTQFKSAYTASIDGSFTTRSTYDYAGRTTAITDALHQTSAYAYDWQGNQVSSTDPKGTTATNSFDAMGRVIQSTQPIDAVSTGLTRYAYDAAGNITHTQTKLGDSPSRYSSTNYSYNSRNWLTEVASHSSDTMINYTQYYYDAMGRPLRMYTGLTAPLAISGLDQVSGGSVGYRTIKYTYDKLGNQLTMTDALNQRSSSTYDLNGAPLTQTDRNGNTAAYTYDVRGRLVRSSVTPSSGGDDLTTAYTYAINGKMLSESDGNMTTSFVYDALGRTIRETSGATVKTYAYNAGDLRTSFTLGVDHNDALQNTYAYDALGRLSLVSGNGVTAAYTYDANGNRASMTYGNGVTTSYAYNLANLVTSLTNKAGSTVLSSYQYTYDLGGNQRSKTDHTGRVTTYDYDDLGRLTREVEGQSGAIGYDCAYTYDQSGNRMTLVSSGPEAYTVAYDYDLNNRLTTETKTAGSGIDRTDYRYDPNGNTLAVVPAMLSEAPAAGVPSLSLDEGLGSATLMQYDGLNRLVRTETGDTLAEYTYRPDGLRHNKVVDGVTTTHVWDGASMVLELENGAISNQYIRGIGLIAANLGGASEYYIFNAHGDVTGLANTNGALVQVHDYDAFGNEKTPDAADSNPFRYCGEYYDSSSGTYYLRNRYYSPGTGRFTQEDPAQAGLNWYTYCGNSPMMWTDPSGLDAILINKHLEGGEWYKDIGNAVGIEHMGGFFQDEDDAWWYFSWEDTVKYKQVDDESIFDSMDSMNAWIIDNEMLSGENPYMTSVYVKGDFTASNNAAAKLFEIYDQSSKTGNANGLPNGNYNVMSNNCGQVAMRLLSMGTLPDGTNVGSYIAGRGYYTTGELPDIHMNNMQNIFYNKAHNFTGFESAMQTQRAKYEGKNDFIQWWYSDLKNNINTIAP